MRSEKNLEKYDSYKDSGIEWIESIPEHWDETQIKYAADCSVSNVDRNTKEDEEPVSVCNYVAVYKNEKILPEFEFEQGSATLAQIEKFTLEDQDVIITKDSETSEDIASAAIINNPNKIVCGYHLAILKSKDYSGLYLFYSLLSLPILKSLQIKSQGVTGHGLKLDAIGRTKLLNPPLEEQKSIASYLDQETSEIDNLIDTQEKLIKLLIEKRASLISETVTKGLNSSMTMKDSGVEWIGEVPNNWNKIKCKYVLFEKSEKGFPDEPLLAATQRHGVILKKDYETRTVEAVKGLESLKLVEPNDFVISLRSFEGGIEISYARGIISPAYTVLELEKNQSKEFYRYLLKSSCFIGHLNLFNRGIRDGQTIHYSELKDSFVPEPPLEEQKAIAQFLDQETSKIDTLIETSKGLINLLKERRSSLISEAVTGKIKVV